MQTHTSGLGARTSGGRGVLGRFALGTPSRSLVVGLVVVTVLISLAVAVLAASGEGLLAGLMLLAVPATLAGIRHPMALFWVWITLSPFLAVTDGGLARRAFWVVHRGLPLVAILAIVAARVVQPHPVERRRFGAIDWSVVGYAVVTFLSILYTSLDPADQTIFFYDKILVPILLFFVVRESGWTRDRWGHLLGAAAWTLATQSLIGILTWVRPGVLPSAWLGRAGERTVGSLELPGTYTTAVLFGAILLVHYAFTASPTRRRMLISLMAAGLGFLMVFMTFSRASWLAGALAAVGLVWLHPKKMTRAVVVAVPILLLAIGAGLLTQQSEYAEARLNSNQTAVSRLPVMYAAVQMWQAQPLFGFGYGNFDRFDRDFQQEVAGYIPEADHASHNVYLTVLAEQGSVGFLLFLAAPVLALFATMRAWHRLDPKAFVGRRLAGSLWIILLVHFVVNNFANMRSIFGLGMWWLLIALVLELVERAHDEPHLDPRRVESETP